MEGAHVVSNSVFSKNQFKNSSFLVKRVWWGYPKQTYAKFVSKSEICENWYQTSYTALFKYRLCYAMPFQSHIRSKMLNSLFLFLGRMCISRGTNDSNLVRMSLFAGRMLLFDCVLRTRNYKYIFTQFI